LTENEEILQAKWGFRRSDCCDAESMKIEEKAQGGGGVSIIEREDNLRTRNLNELARARDSPNCARTRKEAQAGGPTIGAPLKEDPGDLGWTP